MKVWVVVFAVAMAVFPAAAQAATWNITWKSNGHLKRVGPFKDVSKRELTRSDFGKKFGKVEKTRSMSGGTQCRGSWTKRAGFYADFGRYQRAKKPCGSRSAGFLAMGIFGRKAANWRFAGQQIPLCMTLDDFKVRYPATKLNTRFPNGSDEVGSLEETWTISKPYKEISPIYHVQTKPNPVSDVVAYFDRVYETSDIRKECPLAPLDGMVVSGFWVVKGSLWLN